MLCSIHTAFAQGYVSGTVHGENRQPLSGANVRADNGKGFIQGMSTNEKGHFKLLLPEGCYTLYISHVGYTALDKDSLCIEKNANRSLGTLQLISDNKLNTVNIVTEKDVPDDRYIFDPRDILSGDGGSALDVFRNIPLVNVEVNGKIKLRGSRSAQIWIDGRQSGLSGASREAFLANLPASSIERIEIITNPGARFDADGSAGIINIVLKKDARNGLRGNLGLNAGSGNKYGAFARLDYVSSKLIFNVDYSYRYTEYDRRYVSLRNNALPAPMQYLRSNSGTDYLGTHFTHTALIWKPKNSLRLFAEGSFQYTYETQWRYLFQQQRLSNPDIFIENQRRITVEGTNNLTGEAVLGFEKHFKNKKHKISAEASYSERPDTAFREFNAVFAGEDWTNSGIPRDYYTTSEKKRYRLVTGRIDYQLPFGKKMELETGIKAVYRSNNTDIQRFDEDPFSGSLLYNNLVSNHFLYNEQVYAAYAEWSHSIKKWKYKIGLRPEYSFISIRQLTINQVNTKSYWNVYPSAALIFKPKSGHSVRLSYSRRVNRPSAGNLNPFPDYSDPLVIRYGNPSLNPEYTHSAELLYDFETKKHYFTTGFYYKHTSNVIGRFAVLDSASGLTNVTYQNIAQSHSAGFEFTSRFRILKRWNLQAGLNIYYFAIDASNLQTDLGQNNIGGQLKMLNSVKLWKNMIIQFGSTVLSPQIAPQRETYWRYYFDLGIRKEFFRNRLAITLNVSDIFNTDRTISHSYGLNFSEDRNRKKESRIAMLTLTWRFGKQDDTNNDNVPLPALDNGNDDD